MAEVIRGVGSNISAAIFDKGRRSAGKSERAGMRAAQERYDTGLTQTEAALSESRDRSLSAYKPYQEFGQTGIDRINAMQPFSYNPSDITKSPAYQFRLQQGISGVNRGMGASGFLNSGNRAIALNDYAQGLASTEYENDWQRKFAEYQNEFGNNMQIVGIGGTAADRAAGVESGYGTNVANARQNYAMNSAGIETGIGGSFASQRLDIANSWAASNMYAADQNAQAFDRYIMPMMGGGMGSMMGAGGGGGISGGGGSGGGGSMPSWGMSWGG